MKINASISQILSYHNLNLNKRQLDIIRAMQTLERQGKPAYRWSVAREIGVDTGSVTQAFEDLIANGAIKFDTYVRGHAGKSVESYILATKGQGGLL